MSGGEPAARAEAAAVGFTAFANLLATGVPSAALVPLNLGVAAGVSVLARRAGVTWGEMGLAPEHAAGGVRWGLGAAAAAGGAVAMTSAIPAVRSMLADEQASRARGGRLAYEVAIRIPFATALPEELLFRGALLGIFERRRPRRRARAMSALLYGLWHLAPTMRQLRTHPERERLAERRGHRASAILGAIAATTAAGYAFAWLRDRSGSIIAPSMAHAALNAAGLLAGVAAARRSRTA